MKNNILTLKYDCNGKILRQIHSFVCRKSRITSSQLKSINQYWFFFGLDYQNVPLNFCSVFNRSAPIILEIGFGNGTTLVDTALNYPEKNFLGIEVYKPGIGSCLHYAHSVGVANLKVVYYDAVEVLKNMIENHSLHVVQIFFPDPWHKKRHYKRRMLNNNFLKIILKKIKIGGILHIATDSESYAYFILDAIKNIKSYINLSINNTFITRPLSRPVTRFEKKSYHVGGKVFDLMFSTASV